MVVMQTQQIPATEQEWISSKEAISIPMYLEEPVHSFAMHEVRYEDVYRQHFYDEEIRRIMISIRYWFQSNDGLQN